MPLHPVSLGWRLRGMGVQNVCWTLGGSGGTDGQGRKRGGGRVCHEPCPRLEGVLFLLSVVKEW